MGTQPPDEFTDIGSVIYATTGDKIPRWESSDSKVIEQYLDKIETYFEDEYVKNKDGLRTVQEEYYAAFSQGGVVVSIAESMLRGSYRKENRGTFIGIKTQNNHHDSIMD